MFRLQNVSPPSVVCSKLSKSTCLIWVPVSKSSDILCHKITPLKPKMNWRISFSESVFRRRSVCIVRSGWIRQPGGSSSSGRRILPVATHLAGPDGPRIVGGSSRSGRRRASRQRLGLSGASDLVARRRLHPGQGSSVRRPRFHLTGLPERSQVASPIFPWWVLLSCHLYCQKKFELFFQFFT